MARYAESKGDVPTALHLMRQTLDLVPGYAQNVESRRLILNRRLSKELRHDFYTGDFDPSTVGSADNYTLTRNTSEVFTSRTPVEDEGFEIL